ncbi:acyl-CoA--sterol O-acyltransferase 1-like [Malania oleifera]|uniref:acyl-CoA--sterol O-acyltransferase 1-like n=1 Tax=Malania oleifera TaxID=397392 RepID=UPI0025ADA6CF|nr:acyl-CoA--sterol O-acyltransferase 1-like [Malania oleifera]
MEGSEVKNFAMVWTAVWASLSYCYFLGKIVQKGALRFMSILPVVCLFLLLPLNLTSIHLGGITAFFVAWLANFKLLLFAFGRGPLASTDPPLSLSRFAAVACLPIKIRRDPTSQSAQKHQIEIDQSQKPNPYPQIPKKSHKWILNYGTKGLLLGLLLRLYDYSDQFHPKLLLFLYCFHVYFCLELILVLVATLARTTLGMELEPQFREPYLSSSLQDFWGRRWNIMVSSILRPTVYEPVRAGSTRIVGRKWASLPAVFSTFVVSALMHELIFFYLGRVPPTWEITWFFLLHGACLVAEIVAKKSFARGWRLPRLVTGLLTVGFVMVTGFWLFFPQLLRCRGDVRALEEYAAVAEFARSSLLGLTRAFTATAKPYNATSVS